MTTFFGSFEGSPAVSVVVVNYNRLELLQECLKSLEQQSFREFETIVVDNGSDDGSREWLEGIDGVTLISNPDNRGFCGANNQGIARARGRYVALLNNDAVAEPDWLQSSVRAIESGEGIGMVAAKIVFYADPGVIDKVGHLIYPDGQNYGRGYRERDLGQYDQPEEVAWPDGCAGLYRSSMLEQIGGFDEDFFAYADDAELGLRARIAGWRAVYAPGAVVRHRGGSTLGRYSSRRLFLIERNRIWLVAKLFPVSCWALAPCFAVLRLGATALAAIRGRGEPGQAASATGIWGLVGTIVKANLAALGGLPRVLRQRRRLAGIRKLSAGEIRALLRRFRLPLAAFLGDE